MTSAIPVKIPLILCEPDGRRVAASLAIAAEFAVDGPLISCVMMSRGAARPAMFSIQCYRRQSYANRELVVVSARPDDGLGNLVAALGDPTIRLVRAAPASPGELCNIGVAQAGGELVCQWDENDLSAPTRLDLQTAALAQSHSAACSFGAVTLWSHARRWLGKMDGRAWGNTMLVKREAIPIYAAGDGDGHAQAMAMIGRHYRTCQLDAPGIYCHVSDGEGMAGQSVTSAAAYDRWMAEAIDWPIAEYTDFLAQGTG